MTRPTAKRQSLLRAGQVFCKIGAAVLMLEILAAVIILPLTEVHAIDGKWFSDFFVSLVSVFWICVVSAILNGWISSIGTSRRIAIDTAVSASPFLSLDEKEKLLRN